MWWKSKCFIGKNVFLTFFINLQWQEIGYLKSMILKLTERVDRMEKTVDIRIGNNRLCSQYTCYRWKNQLSFCHMKCFKSHYNKTFGTKGSHLQWWCRSCHQDTLHSSEKGIKCFKPLVRVSRDGLDNGSASLSKLTTEPRISHYTMYLV